MVELVEVEVIEVKSFQIAAIVAKTEKYYNKDNLLGVSDLINDINIQDIKNKLLWIVLVGSILINTTQKLNYINHYYMAH